MPTGKELAAAAPQYLGTPYSKMDCQKFVEQCLRDIGIHKDLPGSNAWYREMDWVGSPEACRKQFGSVPVGALLFILDQDGREPEKYQADGLGNASHMGIVTGSGLGAIHSSASRGCVCESKFKDKTVPNGGWNRVGLWIRLAYGDRIDRILRGSGGEEVAHVNQEARVATTGGVLNLRRSPGGSLLDQIPNGETVEVLERGDEWTRVAWHGRTGWVSSGFLDFGDGAGDMIQISRAELQEVYDKLGDLLGLRG